MTDDPRRPPGAPQPPAPQPPAPQPPAPQPPALQPPTPPTPQQAAPVAVSGELAARPPPAPAPAPGARRGPAADDADAADDDAADADDDDDDDDRPAAPRSRRAKIVIAGSAAAGLVVAALVLLGHLNASRYLLGCETREVVAARGRAFPPWGTHALSGDEWKPISIPASFQCVPLETEDPDALGEAYRAVLLERAEALLTAKEVTEVEPAAELLDQALLHARSDSDPHKAARQTIHRMQGDVAYWRATARLQKMTAELAETAKQLEAAAGQRPRFVTDAAAWAAYVRRLADDLRAGPAGERPAPAAAPAPAAPDRLPAPPGVALPVEPGAPGAPGGGSAAAPPPAPAPAPPDAGLPTGGVLL